MPTFENEIDIDVDDFISSCSKDEIKEMIEILKEEYKEEVKEEIGYIKPKTFLEELFLNNLDKIKNNYLSLSQEEIEYLEKISKRF
jgi:hypothetical protein